MKVARRLIQSAALGVLLFAGVTGSHAIKPYDSQQGLQLCQSLPDDPVLIAQNKKLKDCSKAKTCSDACYCHYDNCANPCKDGDAKCVNKCLKSLWSCLDDCNKKQ